MPDDSVVIERVEVLRPVTAATRQPNESRRLWIGTMVLVLALVTGCAIKYPPPGSPGRPECQHDPGHPTIAGKYTPVPEYHDCQRLVVKSGTSLVYGRMAALFLSQAVIDGQVPAVSYSGVPPTGDLSAAVPANVVISEGLPIDSGIIATGAPATTVKLVIPWVQVVADSDYRELGVKKGFNCMYYIASIDAAGTPVALDAKMVFAHESDYHPCSEAPLMRAAGIPLKVTVNGSGRVPTATRWDWSETDQLHVIGSPCPLASAVNAAPATGTVPGRPPRGTVVSTTPLSSAWVPSKWCDVGAATSIGSVPHGTTPDRKAIKGWSDEQYLADPSLGSLARTDIMGTVFPDAGLNTRPRDYYKKTFKTAAFVALRVVTPGPTADAALASYRQRFGYDAVAPSQEFDKMPTIALCEGLASECLEDVPETERPKCDRPTTWWARTQSGPDATERLTRYHCVRYRGHGSTFKMPAVVRWRFHPNPGESNWMPCLPNGCCEIET